MIYIIGLGSNIPSKYGNKLQTLKFAILELENMGVIFSRDDDGKLGTRAFGGQKKARTYFVGDITGSALLHVLYEQSVKYNLHVYEEWFVTKLKKGDVFTFSGRNLELIRLHNMEVIVRKSKSKKTRIPSWIGGRMSFSANLSELLKKVLYEKASYNTPEFKALAPVFFQQQLESIIPKSNQFLIERFQTKEGFHTVFYPFEGYAIHEAMASLIAYRISLLLPITFSMSFNDYGFELLSDKPFLKEAFLDNNLLTKDHLNEDLEKSINISEMARRRFRDIAVISGLVFQGFPNKPIKTKHLQSGSQLFYDVFKDYEPKNLLYQQALEETFDHGMEHGRMNRVFEKISIQNKKINTTQVTVMGVKNIKKTQLIFYDTPGSNFLKSLNKQSKNLKTNLWSGIDESDLVFYLILFS